MSDQPADSITVYSDYVCPFCYLGRASLRRFQEDRAEPLAVDWQPFDLRSQKRGPDGDLDLSADDGKDEAYYEQARQNVRRLQEQYDVEMTQDLATDVDSLDAQVASYHVKAEYPYETWLAFDGAIFDALWLDGRDIGERDTLRACAEDAEIDPDAIDRVIDDDAAHDAVRERFRHARELGVTGVPTFVYGEHAARGAVPPAQLERLVDGA